MKVTGTRIQKELKLLTTELASLNSAFEDTLSYFEGEAKPDPIAEAHKILRVERRIGVWQAAQKTYNVQVGFEFLGENITLQEAVSIVGGYGRVSKLLRSAAGVVKKERYGSLRRRVETRTSTEISSKPSVTRENAVSVYKDIESEAADLRTSIAKANTTVVEIPGLEEAILRWK